MDPFSIAVINTTKATYRREDSFGACGYITAAACKHGASVAAGSFHLELNARDGEHAGDNF